MAGLEIEADAMKLVQGDGASGSQMKDADQGSAGGAQERIFVGTFHLGDDHGRHDPNQNQHHHQLGQSKTESSAIPANAQHHILPVSDIGTVGLTTIGAIGAS